MIACNNGNGEEEEYCQLKISRENPVHGVGSWSALHEREFLSFVELCYSMKGHFCISWSALYEKEFISFMELPYSMKGHF